MLDKTGFYQTNRVNDLMSLLHFSQFLTGPTAMDTPVLSPPTRLTWLWNSFSTPRSSSRNPLWCAAGGPGSPCTSPSDGNPATGGRWQRERRDKWMEDGGGVWGGGLKQFIDCLDDWNEMMLFSRYFFTHIDEGGVDVIRVLLSSFDWNDHSVELIC